MRKLLFVAVLLCSSAWATITVGTAAACNVNSSTCSISLTTSAGQTIVTALGTFNGTIPTSVKLSDGTTTCTQDSNVALDSGPTHHHFFYRCTNIPGGITGVTITLPGSDFTAAIAIPVNGLDNASPKDVMDTTGVSLSANPATTGPMTTTNAADIVFGFYVDYAAASTFAGSGSWTLAKEDHSLLGVGLVYQIVAATSTYTPASANASGDKFNGNGASYKSSSGGATKTCTLSTMGAGPC